MRLNCIKCGLLITLFCVISSQTMAQDFYSKIIQGVASEGIEQVEKRFSEIPEILDSGLEIAKVGKVFESPELCLGVLQTVANLGSAVSQIMPFSEAWTYEDKRGPVVRLRLMLNGKKIHTEVICEDKTLKALELPWGNGDKTPKIMISSTLNSALGIAINLQMQGLLTKPTPDSAVVLPEPMIQENNVFDQAGAGEGALKVESGLGNESEEKLGISPQSNWVFKETRDEFTNANTSFVYLDASKIVNPNYSPNSLILRCDGAGEFDVYVITDGYIGSSENVKVRYKFSDGIPIEENWKPSTDGKAAFKPAGANKILTGLISAQDFLFEITGYNGNTYFSEFDNSLDSSGKLNFVMSGCL
jgi:hypothetical protein